MTVSLEKNKDGVPSFDGSAEKLALFREEALAYTFTLEVHKRYLAGPRLAKELTGVARTVVRRKLNQDPQWLANPRGAYVLIDFLEQAIESPTLVQASNYIHRFFYQLKRRRGETMTEWVNRHSESMWEASRALKRVQKEYGTSSQDPGRSGDTSGDRWRHSGHRSSFQGDPWSSWRNDYYQRRVHEPDVFDDHGRLPEDDEEPADGQGSHHPSTEGWSEWDWSNHGWRDRDQWYSWRSDEYQPPDTWETDVPDFLPDYLTGFLLLNRSGLDAHERANILAAIRGSFSVQSIEKALKEQWRDDDLARRDKQRQYANLACFDDDDGADDEALNAEVDVPDPDCDPGGYEAFMADQREIDSCLEAIRDQKRTLKEARWRQQQVKSNRKFFPSSPYRAGRYDRGGGGSRGDHQSSRGSSSTTSKICLACGGDHPTQSCPKPRPKAQVAEEEAEVAFCTSEVQSEVALHAEPVESALPADGPREKGLSSAILSGKGVIDCGATSTLGSIDAVEKILENNVQLHGSERVRVHPDQRPTFKFGNNGVRDCISSVDLGVDLGAKKGKLQVAVHDIPNQPVLISVKALKSLGAVIDFSTGEVVYRSVDPHAVVPLEEAANGHLLMPLCGDLLAGSFHRRSPFSGLRNE